MRSRCLALLLPLLLAGCAGVEPATPGDADAADTTDTMDSAGDEPEQEVPDCPGHWHAAVTFFVRDERVTFTSNPDYTLEGRTMPLRTHMHRGGESLWHFEPLERECIPLREALATVDVRLEDGLLELSGAYHDEKGWGGTHREEGADLVRAWQRPPGGDWALVEVEALAAGQVPDGAQVLVAFGDHDEGDVSRMQDEATQVPASLRPRGD